MKYSKYNKYSKSNIRTHNSKRETYPCGVLVWIYSIQLLAYLHLFFRHGMTFVVRAMVRNNVSVAKVKRNAAVKCRPVAKGYA